MDQKTPGNDQAPPPYYDYSKTSPPPQTGTEKTETVPPAYTGTGSPSAATPTKNDASSSTDLTTPALKLKIGKNSAFERNYNIWSPDGTVLYTIERHDRMFSSKPELYLRHRSGTEIASTHLRAFGDIEFSIHGAHFEAKKNDNPFSMCWTVDRGDERYEVRHTQTGISARSTKHLKLVDSQNRVLARFISHLARSMHTLGKVEFFGEGVGVPQVHLLEQGGTGTHWQEWCLALLVGIAEKEKRSAQAAAGGSGGG